MKQYRLSAAFIICFLLLPFCCLTASANSSWVWISETRPYDVLLWVAIGTLLIETISIILFAKINSGFKVFTFVTIANLISFAAPYVCSLVSYTQLGMSFLKYLNHWPSYTVGVSFCLVTLLIEFPIVYLALRRKEISNKRLVITIVVSNILTTILVAIVERTLCQGRW